ncbi:MAG: hypothetical protein Q9216_001299 [Gyalolechia sp. 2 TL-2023]
MALVRKTWGHFNDNLSSSPAAARRYSVPYAKNIIISDEVAAQVRRVLEMMMLGRPILDFLVRYFVTEVNWFGTPSQVIPFQDADLFTSHRIDQLLYPPWFLGQYQTWWSFDRFSSVADIESSILFLRLCCYASHFLPSPTHTIDGIKGVSLRDIRKSCEDNISVLGPIFARLDPRGSFIRVQHLAFAGLASTCLGQINASWEALSSATRAAQQISLHLGAIVWPSGVDELEKEMSRRTFCFLYMWDRKRGPDKRSEYNAIAADERYESFCNTFLQTMPSIFALQPDKQWDRLLPTLPMQRQLLHMAIFESLCWNFKPVLFQKAEEVENLPKYKQILTPHNKRALAVAALKRSEGVSALHMMMGGSHTRYAELPGEIAEGRSQTMKTDPLSVGISNVTRAECMQAAHDALSSLQTLAEVSKMAETGAQTLGRLIRVVDSSSPVAQVYGHSSAAAMQTSPAAMQTSEVWSCDPMQEYVTGDTPANLPFGNNTVNGPSSEDVLWNLPESLGPEDFGLLGAGHL